VAKGWSPECEDGVVGGTRTGGWGRRVSGDEEAESRQQEAGRAEGRGRGQIERAKEKRGERRRDCSDLFRTCSAGSRATPKQNVIT